MTFVRFVHAFLEYTHLPPWCMVGVDMGPPMSWICTARPHPTSLSKGDNRMGLGGSGTEGPAETVVAVAVAWLVGPPPSPRSTPDCLQGPPGDGGRGGHSILDPPLLRNRLKARPEEGHPQHFRFQATLTVWILCRSFHLMKFSRSSWWQHPLSKWHEKV